MRVSVALAAAAALALSSCAGVSQVRWTRVDGAVCLTTHAKPTWYSAENETDCLEGGKAQPVATSHEDLSILSGLSGVLGILAGFGAGRL